MLAWFLMTAACIQTENSNEGTQDWAVLPEDFSHEYAQWNTIQKDFWEEW